MIRKVNCALLVASTAVLGAGAALAQSRGPVGDMDSVEVIRDQVYANVDGFELAFDLYLPKGVDDPPLLVSLHPGGWINGSREIVQSVRPVNAGYALASISFRRAGEAPYPAMIHDVKGAIRYLRANADRLGVDASRIGVIGVSSGAHLATLVGTTNGSAAHEGNVGGNTDVSSSVQAIVSFFGASNLTTIINQSTPHGLTVRVPGLTALLGGPLEEHEALAREASTVFQVDAGDPPLLWLHGDQDPQMPINQGHELVGAYEDAGLDVTFEVVHGAGHGGPQFSDDKRTAVVLEFLDRTLRH